MAALRGTCAVALAGVGADGLQRDGKGLADSFVDVGLQGNQRQRRQGRDVQLQQTAILMQAAAETSKPGHVIEDACCKWQGLGRGRRGVGHDVHGVEQIAQGQLMTTVACCGGNSIRWVLAIRSRCVWC